MTQFALVGAAAACLLTAAVGCTSGNSVAATHIPSTLAPDRPATDSRSMSMSRTPSAAVTGSTTHTHAGEPARTTRPSAPSGTAPPCATSALHARIVPVGAAMSQVLSILVFTNKGEHACSVTGYPSIDAALGQRAVRGGANRDTPIPLIVHDGRNFFRSDPGPRAVVLRPGDDASAAMETGTAFQGGAHLDTIWLLTIRAPNDRRSLAVRCRMYATGPAKRDEMWITALVPGGTGPGQ
jgi:hypothetical protein